MIKRSALAFLFLLSLPLACFAADETLTITTYYPSPYGSYQDLTVAGNLGIGTTNPTDKLDVAGAAKIGAGYAGMGRSAPSNGLLVQGNIGIGNTLPSSTLSVLGTADFSSNVGIGATASISYPLFVGGGAYITGNVGIGNSAPVNESLRVSQGNAGTQYNGPYAITADAAGADNTIAIGRAGAIYGLLGVAATSFDVTTAGAYNIRIHSQNSARHVVLSSLASGQGVGVGGTPPTGTKLYVTGPVTTGSSAYIGGVLSIGGGSAGRTVCWKADGRTLGYCSSAPDAVGACTCN